MALIGGGGGGGGSAKTGHCVCSYDGPPWPRGHFYDPSPKVLCDEGTAEADCKAACPHGGFCAKPGPAPPPTPPPAPSVDVAILSYNLQWWKNRLHTDDIVSTINSVGPFDLMAFQESDAPEPWIHDVAKGKIDYECKQGGAKEPPKPEGWGKSGDITICWNTKMFKKVSEGDGVAGRDGWGTRYLHWVRLNFVGSDKHIVMANTHGPVNQCRGSEDWKNVAHNYVSNIEGAMEDGDHMFFTGDFNCGSTPSSRHDPHGAGLDDIVTELRKSFTDIGSASNFKNALYQPDRIYVKKGSDIKVNSWSAVCCAAAGTCNEVTMPKDNPDDPSAPNCIALPADHMLLKASTTIPIASSAKTGHCVCSYVGPPWPHGHFYDPSPEVECDEKTAEADCKAACPHGGFCEKTGADQVKKLGAAEVIV